MKTCFGCGAEIQDDQRLCERCEYGDEGPSEYNWWGSAEYIPTPEEIEASCAKLREMHQRKPRRYAKMLDQHKMFAPPLRKQPL